LDEPTTGLDPGARRDIWEILERLRKEFGTTMILTTHYMEEAEYLCDRILIMDQGKFLAEGTLEELIHKHGEGEIIEITVDKKITLSENSVKGIKKLTWNHDLLKAKIFVENITETLPELIKFVAENQSTILELGCRKMTLDDLFIAMTGRHLHESK
jgi:ABC-2 type transport system ATP-binding protein